METQNTEYEFRFGTISDGSFSASVSTTTYAHLYNRAKSLGARFSEPTTYSVTYHPHDRRVVDGKHQCKTTVERNDFYMGCFPLRYCKSIETDVHEDPPPGGTHHTKTRTSAVLLDTMRLDFSVINDTVFQVELEILDGNKDTKDVQHVLQELCRWDYMPRLPMCPSSLSDHAAIVARHNEFFGFRSRQPWYRVARAVDMPIPLPSLNSCCLTFKYDGVRGLLGCVHGKTYFVNLQGLVILDMPLDLNGYVLDVEAWNGRFVVLDVLIAAGASLRDRPFSERISKFRMEHESQHVVRMPYVMVTQDNLRAMWSAVLNTPSLYDGLMLRHRLGTYRDGEAFKVKPLNRITVDLAVLEDGLYGWSKSERRLQKWASLDAVVQRDVLAVGSGDIWEFLFSGPEHLEAVRRRPDRRVPNTIDTIESVLVTARNPLTFDMLLEKASSGIDS